ncbi:MAG: hypothetical protein ACOQNV_03250 [Mycoplasmoidaceae bacterium]
MAKPLQEISKTDFSKNYNVVKVLTDKLKIMKQLKTFNSNNQAIAFGVKKEPKDTAPIWFKQYQEKINTTLEDIKTRLTNIETRLDNLVKKNNLKE